jgi:hypothetical protein
MDKQMSLLYYTATAINWSSGLDSRVALVIRKRSHRCSAVLQINHARALCKWLWISLAMYEKLKS